MKKSRFGVVLVAACMSLPLGAAAQSSAGAPAGSGASGSTTGGTSTAEASSNAKDNTSTFFGDAWSIGLAGMYLGKRQVNDATIVAGTVRVGDSQRSTARLLLSRHWYFEAIDDAGKSKRCSVLVQGACLGLHVDAGLGSNSGLDMVGIGLGVGFGKYTNDVQRQQHNIGFGIGRVFHLKTLGEGVTANAPPPSGESQVRFRYIDATTAYVFYAYNL